MTKETEEKKYYQRLGIIPTSIDNIKRIIKNNIKNTIKCWENDTVIEKQCFRVVSPAGIGKTAISIQIAEELTEELGFKFNHILVKAPVLSRDDFLCPFPVEENGSYKRFTMLYSDFVPLDPDSYGIFIIDELSRGDQNLQQLLWAVQNECRIHTKDLPKGWFVICLDNPDDSEYSINEIGDAAGLRRTLHMYAEVNAKAFLNYAVKANFHPLVVEFIQIHPDYLYDFDAQKIGMIYANPASWNKVSNILWGFEDEILNNLDDLTTLFTGLLNQSKTRMFLSFIKDRKDISPVDVFYKYDDIRNDILKYVETSNNAKLGQLMESFHTFLITSKPEYSDEELKNISKFLLDIPSDIGSLILYNSSVLNSRSDEFKYVTKLLATLNLKSEDYRIKYYEEMVKIGRKAAGR